MYSNSATVDSFSPSSIGGLFAGGEFLIAGENEHSNIARWDGAEWTHVGAGFGPQPYFEEVFALAVLPNGDLVAGGGFDQLNGAPVNHVARWDGQAWLPVGSGVAGGSVLSMIETQDGDVVAAGSLTSAGGQPVPSCQPDCDQSGLLDFFDFLCFQNAFAAGCP